MNARRPRRCIAACALSLAALAAAAPSALGHAAFEGAVPAPGARVEEAPERVVLAFTEPLNRELSDATLSRASGGRVAARLRVRGRRMELVPAARLVRGAYRVGWRTVSTDDGHPLEGSFGFGVQAAPAAGAADVEQSPLAGAGWLRALSRALLYAALLLFAGALLVRAILGPEWPAPEPEPRRRADALVLDAGLATASLAAAAAILDSADAANRLSASALADYLLANATGVARVLLVALALAALALARRAPRAAALAALAALGCIVAAGHANSADPRGVAIFADWAHLAGGAVWLGGAGLILLAWGPRLRDSESREVVWRDVAPAFGRVAIGGFAVVVVAGTINALVELGSVSDLWTTAYGTILLIKIVLVAGAAAAAWAHVRMRRRDPREDRRPWRALRAEVVLGAGVVVAAGLLVAFPLPPRQLDAATSSAAAIPACDPCPLPQPRPDELAVADQAGSLVVAAWIRREAGRLAGTVRTLDFRGRPARGPVAVPDGRTRPCGTGCATFTAPAGDVLRVSVTDRGRAFTATLPASWEQGSARRARALLERAEHTMRALRSVRESERVTSGPGTLALVRYTLEAPDRLSFTTSRGVRTIQIDRRQWVRTPGEPWRVGPIPGGIPFRTRTWFRWTPYARAVQLLGERGAVAELAAADPATPVWFRLVVDTRTGRVLRERLVGRARNIEHRFFGFNEPVRIVPPRNAIRAG